MILLSHPTGNQNSRAVLHAFAQEELLYEFHTSYALFQEHFLQKKLAPQLARRQFDQHLKQKIKTYPYFEFTQRVLNKIKLEWLVPREGDKISMYDTGKYMDRRIAKRIALANAGTIKAVYAYEDMAKQSFESAKIKQLKCFYDLPIGYWRAYQDLLAKEQQQKPLWASTLTGFQSSEQKLLQKDKELELADHIFVASQFTANTLNYFPQPIKAQLHVIPYGFPNVDTVVKQRTYDFHRTKRPLKLLFVGGLSQRKGLSYLFEAVEAFGDRVELTVVGRKVSEDCEPLNTALNNCCKWIPSLPHPQILELMRASDLFVFPSLFEGFGLVMTEAMSQGTPVIATERTAAPDMITDGKDGYIVKAGSSQELIIKIESLLAQPEKLEQMGKAAANTAAKRPWSVYGQELSQKIKLLLDLSAAPC
jgi:glycosyltransferase involved in cell wall biosynthesis